MIVKKSAMKKHVNLLGHRATDPVTGLEGVITSVFFDLYGCVQYVLTPPASDGVLHTGHWMDAARLKVHDERVDVAVPDFSVGYVAEGRKGPAEKPAF